MRYPNALQIYVNKDKLTEDQFNYLRNNKDIDFEFDVNKKEWTIWIHDDGHFQMTHEIMNYLITLLIALKGVYNPVTKQDHLDLFIEADEIDDFGIQTINGTKYKNVRASELGTIDLSQVKLKRDLYQLW